MGTQPQYSPFSLKTEISRPSNDDPDAWISYWLAQGQPWRTEPEIGVERQKELSAQYKIAPNMEKGIYPFKDVKLSRADVEWLLARHREEWGSLDYNVGPRSHAGGLDLRGADLRFVDLGGLPLTQLRGGLRSDEWRRSTEQQQHAAAIHLEGARLNGADLRRASLRFAHLEGADLRYANLAGASLRFAHLVGTDSFCPADLRYAIFNQETNLEEVILGNMQYGSARLAEARWSGVNLSVVTWEQMKMLGDEYEARLPRDNGKLKDRTRRIKECEQAVRANRQLSIALQSQGLNEVATRFAYRAQVLQRYILRLQLFQSRVEFMQRLRTLATWFFSWFLSLLAGYGYKPGRSFLAYLLVIGAFLMLYLRLEPHLAWYEALVVSMTAFHGRGFSPSTFSPGDPLSIASAIEAFVGLIIEVTFIATLTQRFFNR